MEPPVELAEKHARIVRDAVDFLHQDPFDRRHQRGVNPMPHDIANENARLRIGDLADGEKVAPDTPFRQIAVGEMERAVGLGGAVRERGVTLGQQRLLHFPGQREFLVHLRLLAGQHLGIFLQFLRLKMFLSDVARDAARADDLARFVPHRHLGRGDPGAAAVGEDFPFQLAHNRFAGAQDLLFIGKSLLRVFGQKQVEIGAAFEIFFIGEVEKFPHGLIDG